MPEAVPFSWVLSALSRDRRLIVGVTGLGVVLALAAALLKPAYYTASFSFIPQSSESGGRSGLAALAGQFGLPVGGLSGGSQPPQLYADLLKTREILGPIAADSVPTVARGARVPVRTFLGISDEGPVAVERTVQTLRDRVVNTSVAVRTTGAVLVQVRTKSPYVSLDVAQRLINGLNRYNVVTRQSQAAEERRFTEARLAEARRKLREAEDGLQAFLTSNRAYAGSPQLSFQKDRLEREVGLQQQIVTTLAQQYEDARIREVRDTPVISVIERPTLPVLPDPRGRGALLVVGTFVAAFLGVALAVVRAGWARQQQGGVPDPSYTMLGSEWRSARETVGRS